MKSIMIIFLTVLSFASEANLQRRIDRCQDSGSYDCVYEILRTLARRTERDKGPRIGTIALYDEWHCSGTPNIHLEIYRNQAASVEACVTTLANRRFYSNHIDSLKNANGSCVNKTWNSFLVDSEDSKYQFCELMISRAQN